MRVKLCDVCDFQGGSQPPKEQWITEPQIGYIRMLQIRDFTQNERTIPEYVKLSNSTKICAKDDILIARYGASVGKILTGLEGAYNVAIMKTIPDEEKISKRYLYYFLLSGRFQNSILNVASRAAQAGFNKEDLQSIYLECPCLQRQVEICCILDKVSDLIALRRKQLERLDLMVKAQFVEIFGDPVKNPFAWNQQYLSEITSKIGSGATPKGGKESYCSDGITFIRSMNVYDGRFEYKDLAYINEAQAKLLNNVIVCQNDVFINITGASVARSCIVPNEVLPARVNQHVAIIRCKEERIIPVFLNNLFINRNFKKFLLTIGESGGATRQAITKQQLESLYIIVPPLNLQEEFADFVIEIDKLKLPVQKSLDKLEILKKALMQEYFG